MTIRCLSSRFSDPALDPQYLRFHAREFQFTTLSVSVFHFLVVPRIRCGNCHFSRDMIEFLSCNLLFVRSPEFADQSWPNGTGFWNSLSVSVHFGLKVTLVGELSLRS